MFLETFSIASFSGEAALLGPPDGAIVDDAQANAEILDDNQANAEVLDAE